MSTKKEKYIKDTFFVMITQSHPEYSGETLLKRKSIFSVGIYIVILYLVVSLISCNKENPIVPPPPPTQPDTANRFIWSRKNTGKTLWRLYVADSNNIYFDCHYGICVYYDGITFSYFNFQDPSYKHIKVYGFDKNNVFFTGHIITSDNIIRPVLKKLTNNILTTYKLDTTEATTSDILVVGQEQAWIAARYLNKVYYFDDGTISTYLLNDSVSFSYFYKDKYENLFVFAFKNQIQNKGLMYTYKFFNNHFDLIRVDCYDNFSMGGCLSSYLYRCREDIVMFTNKTGKFELFYFNGNDWISLCETNPGVIPFRIGGWSKDSLIALYNQYVSLNIWNGKIWRKENLYFLLSNTGIYTGNIEVNDGKVYIPFFDEENLESYLIIGKPNKNY